MWWLTKIMFQLLNASNILTGFQTFDIFLNIFFYKFPSVTNSALFWQKEASDKLPKSEILMFLAWT